jgi:ankyrin repeat protein
MQQQLESVFKTLKKKDLSHFLNSRDENGNTPFLAAVSLAHIPLIQFLLEYVAYFNINSQDLESGYTALHKCLLKGQLQIALLILDKVDVDYGVEDNEGLDFLEMLNVWYADEVEYQVSEIGD